MLPFFAYMPRCADGSYYVGHIDDLERRFGLHVSGAIPDCYTKSQLPVEPVWSQPFETREDALAAERQIKGWGRRKKEALIRGDWKTIRQHAWGTRNPMPENMK